MSIELHRYDCWVSGGHRVKEASRQMIQAGSSFEARRKLVDALRGWTGLDVTDVVAVRVREGEVT